MRFPIKIKSRMWATVVAAMWLGTTWFFFAIVGGHFSEKLLSNILTFFMILALFHVMGDWVISSIMMYTEAFEWRGFDEMFTMP